MEASPNKKTKGKSSSDKKKRSLPKIEVCVRAWSAEKQAAETSPPNSSDTSALAAPTTPAKPSSPPRQSTPSQNEDCSLLEWMYYTRWKESDQRVVWGSPQESPVLKAESKVMRLSANPPWSPVSDSVPVSRKPPRRLINNSESLGTPDFMSELTALSERIRAQEELSKKSSAAAPSDDGQARGEGLVGGETTDDATDTQELRSTLCLPSPPSQQVMNQITNESFSALFEDDEEEFVKECMLKCSQESEADKTAPLLVPSRRSIDDSPRVRKVGAAKVLKQQSPRRRAHGGCGSSTSPRKVAKSDSKFCVKVKRRMPVYYVKGRVLGATADAPKEEGDALCSSSSSSTSPSPSRTTTLHNKEFADDSLESVLHNFEDEDVELLSQAYTRPQPSRNASIMTSSPSKAKRKTVSPNKRPVTVQPPPPLLPLPAKSNGYVQKKMVKDDTSKPFQQINRGQNVYSVVVTSDSLSRTSSTESATSLQCTPEEIEKKKQEARLKLEKKRMTVLAVNPYRRQLHRPFLGKRSK